MKTEKLLACISRDFLQINKVNKYRMKKISDMTDNEVIQICHSYCEENNLIYEWADFREKTEYQYRYCSYLEEYIDEGLCYDLQMITGNYIKPSALHEIKIDKGQCEKHCLECKYRL